MTMNNVGRILLLAGAVVLALLVGVLIGRGQRAQPTAAQGNSAAMQINTTTPPPPPAAAALAAKPAPLPAPVQAAQPAPIPKIAPDAQVQEDAAAVGMTTRESAQDEAGAAPTTSAPAPAPKSAAGGDAPTPQDQPPG
jgi:hypothetical protein